MTSSNWLVTAAVCTGLIACVTDLRTRRIPNVLTLGAAVIAVAARLLAGGWLAAAYGAGGWAVGLILLLPLFALKGLGGGDVKLLAAFGAWVGTGTVIWTGLYGTIAGGLLALLLAVWHGSLSRTLANVSLLLTHWRVAGVGPVAGLTLEDSKSVRLAYAIPLTVGLVVALWTDK